VSNVKSTLPILLTAANINDNGLGTPSIYLRATGAMIHD